MHQVFWKSLRCKDSTDVSIGPIFRTSRVVRLSYAFDPLPLYNPSFPLLVIMAAQYINIIGEGVIVPPPPASSSHYAPGLAPAPATARQDDSHKRGLKRLFIGPMPEKVVQPEVQRRKSSWRERRPHLRGHANPAPLAAMSTLSLRDQENDSASSSSSSTEQSWGGTIEEERLFRYFLRKGGHRKEWNRDTRRNTEKEIRMKWKESGWYHAWKGQPSSGQNKKWVGKSFVIGQVLGTGETASDIAIAVAPDVERGLIGSSTHASVAGSHRTESEVFVATPVSGRSLNEEAIIRPGTSSPLPEIHVQDDVHSSGSGAPASEQHLGTVAISSTSLVPSQLAPSQQSRPQMSVGSLQTSKRRSALKLLVGHRDNARKSVNFAGESSSAPLAITAPPEEVLARVGSETQGTSAEQLASRRALEDSAVMSGPLNWQHSRDKS